MLTYQIRPRIFRLGPGEPPTFPAHCELCFHFRPAQPFGTESGGGLTVVVPSEIGVQFNANSGEITFESKPPLSPLDVTINEPNRTLRLVGTTFSISQEFASRKAVEQVVQSVYFALPALLNIPFADPPYIERVDGKIGSSSFRWELAIWRVQCRATSQLAQEEQFTKAWKRMGVLADSRRRRLVAGLHYFHVACRLAREGCTAGEFVAEVILNLTKTLEVLFPPTGNGHTRDAARIALRALGFSDKQIECDFIPAMALRDEIDVAHVELGLFESDQLQTIHAFTERAEGAFHEMFERLLAGVESNEMDIASHELGPPRNEAIKLIERLR
ncbi:MAG: hypothetical protein K8S99_00500 [Planctomycetes bacterium]|nr:hypothetical protein [Planctomycetota bacterium]